jgi:hypothetical protein
MIEGPSGETEIPIGPDAACNLFDYRGMLDELAVYQQNYVVVLSFGLSLFTNPNVSVVNLPVVLE